MALKDNPKLNLKAVYTSFREKKNGFIEILNIHILLLCEKISFLPFSQKTLFMTF